MKSRKRHVRSIMSIDQKLLLKSLKSRARVHLIFLGPFLILVAVDSLFAGALFFCFMVLILIVSVAAAYRENKIKSMMLSNQDAKPPSQVTDDN